MTVWSDFPARTSPISAAVLNAMEETVLANFPTFVRRTWVEAITYDAIQDHVLNFMDTTEQPSLYPSATLYPGMVGGPYPGMPLHVIDVSPTDLYPADVTTKLTAVALNDLESRLAAVLPGFVAKTWVNWPSTSTPMNAAAMSDLFFRALNPAPPPEPPTIANLTATFAAQGTISSVLSGPSAFQPLFAVAGGPGRNNQAAFQYIPLPTDVGIDATIDQTVFQTELNAKAQASRWINYNDFTTKRVVVPDTQPLEPVLLWRSNWGGGFTGTNYPSWALDMDKVCRGGFPVPPSYVPDAGTDKELALLQPTFQYPPWASLPVPLTGRYFEGWIFEKNPAYDPTQPKAWPNYIWRCGWPARACGLNIWPGHFLQWTTTAPQTFWPYTGYDGANPSNPNGTWQSNGEGASASGIALADSELLISDLDRNIVGGKWGLGHCIGLSVPSVGGFRWPAQRSDANQPSSYPIKYGMRVCLPADYVIPSTGIHPVCRALIENCIISDDATKPGYGMVIHEQTSSAVVIKAQPGAQKYWTGVSPSDVLTPFPWNQLQVIVTGSDSSPVRAAAPPSIPGNTVTPVIGGPVAQSRTLGLYRGAWSGSLPITYAYQWQSSPTGSVWSDIGGATGQTYIPVSGDVTKFLRGRVTATNSAGSTIEYSSVTDAVAASAGAFTRDSFTGTNGVTILSRAGEFGATWTRHVASTASTDDTIQSNKAMGPVGSGTNIYYASGTPPSASYDVTLLVEQLADNNSSHSEAAGRMSTTLNTMYFMYYSSVANSVSLNVIVDGVNTVLESLALAPKVSMTLRMVGDQISGIVDGALVLGPVTDTTLTTAGRAGYRHGGISSTTAGIHIDNFEAADNGGGGGVVTGMVRDTADNIA